MEISFVFRSNAHFQPPFHCFRTLFCYIALLVCCTYLLQLMEEGKECSGAGRAGIGAPRKARSGGRSKATSGGMERSGSAQSPHTGHTGQQKNGADDHASAPKKEKKFKCPRSNCGLSNEHAGCLRCCGGIRPGGLQGKHQGFPCQRPLRTKAPWKLRILFPQSGF